MDNTAIVVCLHGDETFGLDLAEKMSGKMPVFIGNPAALEKKQRRVDVDLNRSFPGDENSNFYEERRAAQLMNRLKEFDCIIDIHSSSCDIPLFGIITKPNEFKFDLARRLGLKKVITMSEDFASGRALIDHVPCGISLEIGPHEKMENADEIVKAIGNLDSTPNNEMKILEVFELIRGEDNVEFFIENFKPVKQGDLIARGREKNYYAESDFIPVFVGERAYKGILCLAARKI